MKSSLFLTQCLVLCMILQVSTASVAVSATNLSDQVRYYYNSSENLSVSTTIRFQPTDVDYSSFNFSQTTKEHGWLGALPLATGYAVKDFSDVQAKVNTTLDFSVDQLSINKANLTISLDVVLNDETENYSSSASGSFLLFEGTVAQGDTGSTNRTINIVFSGYNLDNGSLLPNESYLALLSNENSTYYSTLSVRLTTLDEQSWDHMASISLNLHARHNPEFFDLMLSRLNRTDTSLSQLDREKPVNPLTGYLIFAGIFVAVALLFYLIYRRLK